MYELLTNEQMAKADQLTTRQNRSGWELMQAAGKAVAEIVRQNFSKDRPILVLCGPGNNGGDGFVAAKYLQEAGRDVRVACLKSESELTGDAAKAYHFWNGPFERFDTLEVGSEIIIDAVLGTGLKRALQEPIITLFQQIQRQGNVVMAVDIPSGVSGDNDWVDVNALQAEHTITFFRKKLGHVLFPGAQLCGAVHIEDIGISADVLQDTGLAALENTPELWRSKWPECNATDHKYNHGHAKIFAAPEMTGATRLAATACARMGAGLTSVLTDSKQADVYRMALPPHIIVREDLSWHDDRVTAVLLGPGGGEEAGNIAELVHSQCSVILDAQAILKAPKTLHERVVLTPHEGEFARAFPNLIGHKLQKAQEVANQTGAIIVLKGPDTVIAAPNQTPVVNIMSSPYLATAGTGDVLAGMITGLVTQGMPAFKAACAAVWMHGKVGQRIGRGLVATDMDLELAGLMKEEV